MFPFSRTLCTISFCYGHSIFFWGQAGVTQTANRKYSCYHRHRGTGRWAHSFWQESPPGQTHVHLDLTMVHARSEVPDFHDLSSSVERQSSPFPHPPGDCHITHQGTRKDTHTAYTEHKPSALFINIVWGSRYKSSENFPNFTEFGDGEVSTLNFSCWIKVMSGQSWHYWSKEF